jgi:glycosyltransferase involved in cell wall biosynthesis
LLHVGRLGQEKSVDVVLRAMAEILRESEAHLALIGVGPDQEELERLARELGILEHLTFVGSVPYAKMGGYYRLAELFLFGSVSETQGLVLWEAQAVGVPVVSVGAEGTLAGVEEGSSGYLVAPGDHRGLAQKTLELLKDEDLHRRFSAGARKFADQRSAKRVAEKVVAMYDEATQLVQIEPRRLKIPFPQNILSNSS